MAGRDVDFHLDNSDLGRWMRAEGDRWHTRHGVWAAVSRIDSEGWLVEDNCLFDTVVAEADTGRAEIW